MAKKKKKVAVRKPRSLMGRIKGKKPKDGATNLRSFGGGQGFVQCEGARYGFQDNKFLEKKVPKKAKEALKAHLAKSKALATTE